MKRTILFLAIIVAMVMGAKAQQQTATLQRGNSTTYYYGEDAFKEAYNAANDGSVITLSAGYFNTVDSVCKQITIRGNGYTGEKTVIGATQPKKGTYSLDVCADNVKLEGLFLANGVRIKKDLENLFIKRSYIEKFYSHYETHQNTTIEKCKVGYIVSFYHPNFCIKNSYVNFCQIAAEALFLNSIVGNYRNSSSYRNCIINVPDNGIVTFNDTQEVIDNVFFCGIDPGSYNIMIEIGSASTISIDESTRYSTPTLPDIETSNIKGNSVALFDDIFNYTNEENPLYAPIITTITGDDGTVVGPYGGTGFSEHPAIPRITESKIDTYTDGDGKLNVKVKVEVGQ